MEYLPSYTNDLYLMHHGVKGQKWGVRRYQNKDGSLTTSGKKHKKVSEKISDTSKKAIKKLQDRGDNLRDSGHTIIGNTIHGYYKKAAINNLGKVAAESMGDKNVEFKIGDLKIGELNADTITKGAAIASNMYGLKTRIDNRLILDSYRREYYRSNN
jgi:hypothetical protein